MTIGPRSTAPAQTRVRSPITIGPLLSSSIAPASICALAARGREAMAARAATDSTRWSISRHHMVVPPGAIAFGLGAGNQALEAVHDPDRVGEDQVQQCRRREWDQQPLAMMDRARRTDQTDDAEP